MAITLSENRSGEREKRESWYGDVSEGIKWRKVKSKNHSLCRVCKERNTHYGVKVYVARIVTLYIAGALL